MEYDLICFSHHGTDPAKGFRRNAYDLVRIHLYGEDNNKGSKKKMAELMKNDEKIIAKKTKEFEQTRARYVFK